MPNPFDQHPAYGGSTIAMVRDAAQWEARQGRFCCFDPTASGGNSANKHFVAVGKRVILDIGMNFDGAIAFKPKVLEIKSPRGMPPPALPPGTESWDWQPASWMQIVFEDFGRRRLRINGKIFLNTMDSLLKYLDYISEVQAGKIPECIIGEPQVVPTDYGDFYAPVFEIVDYRDRDQDVFGPRIVPPPPPSIGGGQSAPPLPPPANDPTPEPVKPADEFKPEPDPGPAPEPEPEPELKPAATNDPLARYRPSGRKAF
jgi:hypothetical protein